MLLKLLQGFVLLLLIVVPSQALIGLDTAPLISTQATFDCLKSAGYEFANVRAFTLEGVDLDLNVKDTLIYSKRAGLRPELFIRPCRGKSAKFQVDLVILVVAEEYYERMWIYLQ